MIFLKNVSLTIGLMHSEGQWGEHKYLVDIVFEMLVVVISQTAHIEVTWYVIHFERETHTRHIGHQGKHQWQMDWMNSLEMILPKGHNGFLCKSTICSIFIPGCLNYISWFHQLCSFLPSILTSSFSCDSLCLNNEKRCVLFFFLSNLILCTYTHKTK